MGIKLESVTAVQKHFTLFKRNEKAKAYSAKVAQKRQMEYRKELTYIGICVSILLVCGGILANYTPTREITVDVIGTHTEYINGNEEVYFICRMPNGEIHEYAIDNTAENVSTVTFDTKGSKDYASYEVVKTN